MPRRIPVLILTPRQAEIVELVISGKTYKEIGHILNIKYVTVQSHLRTIYKALGVHSRKTLFTWAMHPGTEIRIKQKRAKLSELDSA